MPKIASQSMTIQRVEQLQALRTPLRQQLVSLLEFHGPSSVAELATHLRRPSESLYYHVNKLTAAGLLVEAERRPAGNRMESVFALASRSITIDPEARSPRFLRALGALYSATLRAADRTLQRALETERSRRGPRVATDVRQFNVRLTPTRRRELKEHLCALEEFLDEHRDATDGEVYSLTTVLALEATERS